MLKYDVFRFGYSFYQKINGKAMGTPMAPNYANIFMDKFERKSLSEYFIKPALSPLSWFTVFFTWISNKESLNDFIQSSEKSNIKSKFNMDVNISQNSVNLLDVRIILGNRTLKTTLFTKPIDSHLSLNYISCYPSHVIQNFSERTVYQNSTNMFREKLL